MNIYYYFAYNMKYTLILTITLFIPIWPSFSQGMMDGDSDFPILKGPYLGQKPPGIIPEIFAPGIVSTEMHEHSIPSFSPDGNQLLWYSQFLDDGGFPGKVIESSIVEGKWTEPEFFDAITFKSSSAAFFSPDGNRIYFTSKGNDEDKSIGGYDIWHIEKSENSWGLPKNLGSPINGLNHDFGGTLSKDLTLYFSSEIDPETNLYGIYRSELIDGKYQTPELLPANINTKHVDWTPFIAPDESYLLFSSNRPNGNGGESGDIYVSYKNPDNTWTDPVNLGPTINWPDSQERYPYVSPDGKFLFYASNKFDKEITSDNVQSLKFYREKMTKPGNSWNDIYWVSSQIIEDLKPQELKR